MTVERRRFVGASPRRLLAALRLILGGVAYVAPRTAARAFAIDPDEAAAMPSAIRLFGARELVLGVAIIGRRSDSMRWLVLGTVADSLDLLTVGLGLRANRLNPATAAISAVMAGSAVGLGLTALRERAGFTPASGNEPAIHATS
jgi:hypothetical protein